MNENKTVKGYKVFEPDWTCRGLQYTCPGTFEEDVTPSVCGRGFRFCVKAADCFQYYDFNPDNKVAEVIAYGDVDSDGIKTCTNKIQIIREVPWTELLEIVNTGKGCSGIGNSGNDNSGNYNSGNRNSGYWNSGDYNSGDWNSGICNSGNHNSGNHNSGDYNSGNYNSSDYNSGHYNNGIYNSGNYNSGHCNSGNHNSGDWNSGNHNSGNGNSGNYNSGNYNSGNHNSGDWNKTSFSAGCFCTEEPKIMLFNKPSNWTMRDWENSDARRILNRIPAFCSIKYVYFSKMSEQEKADHPEAETTGGYLKIVDKPECGQIWWRGLSDSARSIVKAIPNFDKTIFKEITGIDVDE